MTTYQIRRGQPFAPEPLEFDDLEIRCTWSGLYEDLANLRISLEVKCIPDTSLQLLSVRDPTLFFEESFIERLPQSDEHDLNTEAGVNTPQSPLFGFSPLAACGRNRADSSPQCESPSGASHASLADSCIEDTEGSYADSEHMEEDSQSCGSELLPNKDVFPICSEMLPSINSVPESPILSRKRSATDADLSDSEMYNNSGALKDVTNREARQTSPVTSSGTNDIAKETTASDLLTLKDLTYARSPNKLLPTRIPGLTVLNENVSPRKAGIVNSSKHANPEKLKLLVPSSPPGKQSQKPTLIPKPTFTSLSESLALKPYAETVVGSGDYANNMPTAEDGNRDSRVRFQTPTSTTTGTDSSGGQLLSPVQSPVGTTKPSTPFVGDAAGSSDRGTKSCRATQRSGGSEGYHERADAGVSSPSYGPEVYFADGLVILDNSENLQSGTYKITITASYLLPHPSHEKGWSAIEISGLPRMRNGKSGFFLFLMPAQHGLELRTTNVKRAKIVENCLITEFVNARNLVIPLRRCDRSFFGEVTDFTVDQEIVAHSMVRTAAAGRASEQPFIQTKYHAMCSMTLPNRCFWTETCAISLYLDGGPDGAFRCDLTCQKDGPKKINISKEGAEVGTSRIHITCSPKDLERLCLSWVTKFPGIRAGSWVPRIYSSASSRERSRDSLRYELLEVLNDPSYLHTGIQAPEIGVERTRSFSSVKDVKSPEEKPSQQASVSPHLSQIKQAIRLHIVRCARAPDISLKKMFIVLCLAFLAFGIVKSAVLNRNHLEHSSVETHLQATEQDNEMSKLEFSKELLEDRENPEYRGSPISSMNIFELADGYTAAGTDSAEAEPSMMDKEHKVHSVSTEIEADPNIKSSVSFRDKVDYWLGWTGPV